MKIKTFLLGAFASPALFAQVLTPIGTTGYNLDAIAENTTAVLHTSGAIDGSDYVMYSAAYGTIYSTGSGLPNNGLVTSLTRTYQLQPYNQNNLLYLTGGQTGTLAVNVPASYAALGILAFATEGSGTMDVTIHFTDNSTQLLSSQLMPDWFGTGSAILSAFDRCNRTSGNPDFQTSQPKMFSLDIPVNCANRNKLVSQVVFQNSGTSARLCIMAMSGAAIPSFSATVQNVSCSGGTNGSASITPTGGFPPFSYTIGTIPPQFTDNPQNLVTGVYSYTAQDVAQCAVTSSFAVGQSVVPQPSLQIVSSSSDVCAGSTVTFTASGASTYSWSSGSTLNIEVQQPGTSAVYTVQGTTQHNCLRSGTVSVTVHALPAVDFKISDSTVCVSDAAFNFSATPVGGIYTGKGTMGNLFDPAVAGTGVHKINYLYTDNHGCKNADSASVAVYSLAPPVIVNTASAVCEKSVPYQVSAVPGGGDFSGQISSTGHISTNLPGNYSFNYSITSGPCEATTFSSYTVIPLPVLTFSMSKTKYCSFDPEVALNASPGPGTFSGPGVNGYFFKPSPAITGTQTITYSYTANTQCSNTAEFVIVVEICGGLADHRTAKILVYPNPSNGVFSISSNTTETLFVVDVLGKTIASFQAEANVPLKVTLDPGYSGVFVIVNTKGQALGKVVLQ